jgi:hypothetical protein
LGAGGEPPGAAIGQHAAGVVEHDGDDLGLGGEPEQVRDADQVPGAGAGRSRRARLVRTGAGGGAAGCGAQLVKGHRDIDGDRDATGVGQVAAA